MSELLRACSELEPTEALKKYLRWGFPAVIVAVSSILAAGQTVERAAMLGVGIASLAAVLAIISELFDSVWYLKTTSSALRQRLSLVDFCDGRLQEGSVATAVWQLDVASRFSGHELSPEETSAATLHLRRCFDEQVHYHRSSPYSSDASVSHTLFAVWILKLLHGIPNGKRIGVYRARQLVGPASVEAIRHRVLADSENVLGWRRFYASGSMASLQELHALWSVAWELDCDDALSQRYRDDISDFVLGCYWSGRDGAFSMFALTERASVRASLFGAQLVLAHDPNAIQERADSLLSFLDRSWTGVHNMGGYGTRPGSKATVPSSAFAVELMRVLDKPLDRDRQRKITNFVLECAFPAGFLYRLNSRPRSTLLTAYSTALALDLLEQCAFLESNSPDGTLAEIDKPFGTTLRSWQTSDHYTQSLQCDAK
jgi:hypothetical protein